MPGYPYRYPAARPLAHDALDHPGPLFVAAAFERGLYSRVDVATWVAEEIERRPALPDALLELTILRPKHDVDITALLRALSPGDDDEARARNELCVLREMVRTKRLPVHHAIYVATRIIYDALPMDGYVEAIGLEDRYELAAAGTYGAVEQAERDIVAFLDRYAKPAQ